MSDTQETHRRPNHVRAIREAAKLPPSELAKRCSMEVRHLVRIEEQVKRPSKAVLQRLAIALNCTPEELLLEEMSVEARKQAVLDDIHPSRVDGPFPNKLRQLRELSGLSGRALGGQCGLSHMTISKLERGQTLLKRDVAAKIAQALECQPEDLYYQPVSTGPGA